MIKNKIYPLLLMISVLLASCSKEEIAYYDKEDTALYFNYGKYVPDSIMHSFFFLPATVLEYRSLVRVRTMGKVVSEDRPIKIIQLNEGDEDAAIAGVHYVAFDDPRFLESSKIEADSNAVNLPIILLRHSSIETKTVRLEIGIAPNEYFRNGIDEYQEYTISTTAMVEKPGLWNSIFLLYFGKSWGPEKMRFIIRITGYTEWDKGLDMSLGYYYGNKCKQALFEEGPIYEADGTEITFLQ